MAKIKDLLKDTTIETAINKRKCHRSRGKHFIRGGQACLVVRDAASGGSRNYCTACAKPMLTNALARLEEFATELYGATLR